MTTLTKPLVQFTNAAERLAMEQAQRLLLFLQTASMEGRLVVLLSLVCLCHFVARTFSHPSGSN